MKTLQRPGWGRLSWGVCWGLGLAGGLLAPINRPTAQAQAPKPVPLEQLRPTPGGAAVLQTQSISVNNLAIQQERSPATLSTPIETSNRPAGDKLSPVSNIEITKAGSAPIDPIEFFRVPGADQGVRVRVGQTN